MLLLCSSHLPIGPQPYPVMYVVANPVVRGLVDRKRWEEHLQSSNESMKTKQKTKQMYNTQTRLFQITYTLSLFVCLYLTYGRWTSTCLVANHNNCNVTTLPVVTEDIFPSLPGSRLRHLIVMQVQALLHLVNQWSYFTYSRSRETLSSSTEARIKLMIEEGSRTYISSTYPYKMRKYYFRLPTRNTRGD